MSEQQLTHRPGTRQLRQAMVLFPCGIVLLAVAYAASYSNNRLLGLVGFFASVLAVVLIVWAVVALSRGIWKRVV